MFQSKVAHIINNQIEAKYHVINYDINSELKTIELDISMPKFDGKINQNINAVFFQNNIKNIDLTIHQSIEENQDLDEEIKKLKLEIMKLKNKK
jgi:predicted RNase H-like nuclease (RuvC/YqgF family)